MLYFLKFQPRIKYFYQVRTSTSGKTWVDLSIPVHPIVMPLSFWLVKMLICFLIWLCVEFFNSAGIKSYLIALIESHRLDIQSWIMHKWHEMTKTVSATLCNTKRRLYLFTVWLIYYWSLNLACIDKKITRFEYTIQNASITLDSSLIQNLMWWSAPCTDY